MLNRRKQYYENNKELLWERAKNKYRSLSEDEKNIKKHYQKTRYHNMSDEEKQRLKDYQKNYREARKQQRNFIDIFIKNNCEEYEKFMNNIDKKGNL